MAFRTAISESSPVRPRCTIGMYNKLEFLPIDYKLKPSLMREIDHKLRIARRACYVTYKSKEALGATLKLSN